MLQLYGKKAETKKKVNYDLLAAVLRKIFPYNPLEMAFQHTSTKQCEQNYQSISTVSLKKSGVKYTKSESFTQQQTLQAKNLTPSLPWEMAHFCKVVTMGPKTQYNIPLER